MLVSFATQYNNRHQWQVDLWPLKVVSESRVAWATSVPILVFLGLSVLDLGPMYATAVVSRQTKASLNASALWGQRHTRLCGKPRKMPSPLYAARCSPAPAHTRFTPAAPSAPSTMNIHDRQAAARSGYDYGVVHINYVVTWTADQSGLVTLCQF